MANGRKRRQLTDDDKRVWKTLASTIVKSLARGQAASTIVDPSDANPKIPRSDAKPEKANTRRAAQTRASHEELADLVSANSRYVPSRNPGASQYSVGPGLDLTPGSTKDVDRRTATRLRQGRIPIEARMDLHGMTRDRAFQAVQDFISQSAMSGKRCVILVTGKGLGQSGGGVLRNEAPIWLNLPQNRKYIISFSYAQPKDGGTGALYIYLKRPDRVAT